MTAKTIYLVRHGQTTYNRLWKHQYLAVPLSSQGNQQAEAVARELASVPFDVLISSDVTRARQTAEHIAKATRKEIIFEPLFRELNRPSDIVGKYFLDPRSVWIFGQLYLRATNLKWRHQDEENFAEFRDRAHKAIEFLEQYDAERIVIVSHRIMIGGMLAALACRFACSMHSFVWKTVSSSRVGNCSITTLTYDPDRAEPWQVENIGSSRHLLGM